MLIALHKPFGVLSQFTPDGSPNRRLAEFGLPKKVYPIGRLDADSEGLLLLSDEPALNQRLLNPSHSHARLYWAQVEKIPTPESLRQLEPGLSIQGRQTLPCRAWLLEPQPTVPPRVRKSRCSSCADSRAPGAMALIRKFTAWGKAAARRASDGKRAAPWKRLPRHERS